MRGLLIAAPFSGSGKTTVTLGLLRALADRGIAISPGKAGPDYIDPAYHTAASRSPCINYDPWAMRPELLLATAAEASDDRLLVIEGMMGLHDAAADGTGSPADLAALVGLAVVLVVDCSRFSHSVAALVKGYAEFRADVVLAGVILNKVASPRHEAMLRAALDGIGMPVFGAIGRDAKLALPERHLGLVQAGEHRELEAFIAHAAAVMAESCALDALVGLACPRVTGCVPASVPRLPPPGQHVAVAQDTAFAFAYAHLIRGWREQGAAISFFSPLADEGPDRSAEAVYLPGGYPELHGGTLENARHFRQSMLDAASRGVRIYGECGGYMALGEAIISADGATHRMLGLLPLVTSFAERRRHLGYRRLTPLSGSGFDRPMTAHEFHYSTVVSEGAADRLFSVQDASGADLGQAGLRRANVSGSYMHLIDLAAGSS